MQAAIGDEVADGQNDENRSTRFAINDDIGICIGYLPSILSSLFAVLGPYHWLLREIW